MRMTLRPSPRGSPRSHGAFGRSDAISRSARDEGLSQRNLGDRLLAAKSNVTGLLQRLEAAELIRRETDELDARGHRVFLTAAGRRLLGEGVRAQASVVQLMMEDINQSEARTIGRLMRKVGEGLDAALDAPRMQDAKLK